MAAEPDPPAQGPKPVVGSTPVPDPTELTSRAVDALRRELTQLYEVKLDTLRQRMGDIDLATQLRWEQVQGLPVIIEEKVQHQNELTNERFASIALQFKERDTRSERESRDNKVAVDAAFAAQKEAAARQDEANQKSIDKSEKATNESISKLGDVVKASTEALTDKIDDLKGRQSADVSRLELLINGILQARVGGRESTTDRREANGAVYAAVGFGITLILAAITVVGVLAAGS